MQIENKKERWTSTCFSGYFYANLYYEHWIKTLIFDGYRKQKKVFLFG